MSYRIEIDRQTVKAMAGLPKKAQRQIVERIDSLADNPFPPDAEQIKGQTDIWRIRSGEYRIAYTARRRVLYVLALRVGAREDFYRYFDR
jgi:mRNA interferase RelE/StbE